MSRMRMTNRMHICPGVMHSGVYQEPSSVGTATLVPTNHITIQVNEDHAAGFQEAERHANWIGSECVVLLRVANRDVA